MDKQIEIKRGEGVMVDLLNQEMNELQEGLKQKQDKRFKHGKTGTRLFNIWQNMKERCYCETNQYFQYYGGKGIKICDEWKNNFNSFYDWAMRNGYEESLTIERIDVNENYKPSNCKWATWEEQSLNKNDTHFLEYKGVKKPLTVWAREKGINPSTLLYRIKRGWTVERALETKVVK